MAGKGLTAHSLRRLAALPGRLRETGRLHWHALSRAGRVSIAGVAASAALAVALGVIIPRTAEHHALESRLESIRSLVRILETEHLVPPVRDHLTGSAYERFDNVVRGGLLGGENLRVKLWNLAGEIVYSDERKQVGERFPIGPNLASALTGHATVEITDLSAEENRLDRSLGSQALEFYVPLRGERGEVIGAFEVYQENSHVAAHLSAVRNTVWIAVGTGLSILFVFLAFLFGATAKAMAAERRAAQDRAEDLGVLLRTSRMLSSEPELGRTAPDVLSVLSERLGLRCAAVLLDGGEPRFALARTGRDAACGPAVAGARRARDRGREVERTAPGDQVLGHADTSTPCCVLAVPFSIGADQTGALVACREAGRPYGARERALISGVAGQLGVAAENARLFTDLQGVTEARGRLLRRLVDAQEEERRHLVGDLHDGMGQALTRVLYGLRGSRARLDPSEEEVAGELTRLESLVDELIVNLRRYMAEIRPALLEDLGLPEALEALAREQEREAGLRIDVRANPLPPMEQATAITLFRAAQEAVINARKHADARYLWIELGQQDGHIVLEVGDDGRGAEELRDGVGLTYMRERVAFLGGRVDVTSRPGIGTTVTVVVPAEVAHGDGSSPGR